LKQVSRIYGKESLVYQGGTVEWRLILDDRAHRQESGKLQLMKETFHSLCSKCLNQLTNEKTGFSWNQNYNRDL